jgi:hypothetical protein
VNRKPVVLSAALAGTILLAVFTILPHLRTPAQVHAQDSQAQLYLNRAQKIETNLDRTLSQAAPLSLTSSDIDGDGINDLAIGLSTQTGGALAIRRGNLDAFAPQSEASFWAIARSEFPSPYLPGAQVVSVPDRPDFLAAGDFIGENGIGMAAAARGGRSIHLVGRGESAPLEGLKSFDMGGSITALASVQL